MVIKIIKEDNSYLYEMSKLTKKYANKALGDFGEFIYFSPSNSSHGPRIKFYGGTKESSTTKNAPTMSFDVNGNTQVELVNWMNKKNCPNAFNNDYVIKVENFIKTTLPILLLVWFSKLDEADALEFFKGNLSINDLILCMDVDEVTQIELIKAHTLKELHKICKTQDLYKFD